MQAEVPVEVQKQSPANLRFQVRNLTHPQISADFCRNCDYLL